MFHYDYALPMNMRASRFTPQRLSPNPSIPDSRGPTTFLSLPASTDSAARPFVR